MVRLPFRGKVNAIAPLSYGSRALSQRSIVASRMSIVLPFGSIQFANLEKSCPAKKNLDPSSFRPNPNTANLTTRSPRVPNLKSRQVGLMRISNSQVKS